MDKSIIFMKFCYTLCIIYKLDIKTLLNKGHIFVFCSSLVNYKEGQI